MAVRKVVAANVEGRSRVIHDGRTHLRCGLGAHLRGRGWAARTARPIAAQWPSSHDEAAKNTAAAFLDAIGYDAYDVGPLGEGWRYQRDTTAYAYSADGSFEHPRPADGERLASLLAQAKRYRNM